MGQSEGGNMFLCESHQNKLESREAEYEGRMHHKTELLTTGWVSLEAHNKTSGSRSSQKHCCIHQIRNISSLILKEVPVEKQNLDAPLNHVVAIGTRSHVCKSAGVHIWVDTAVVQMNLCISVFSRYIFIAPSEELSVLISYTVCGPV